MHLSWIDQLCFVTELSEKELLHNDKSLGRLFFNQDQVGGVEERVIFLEKVIDPVGEISSVVKRALLRGYDRVFKVSDIDEVDKQDIVFGKIFIHFGNQQTEVNDTNVHDKNRVAAHDTYIILLFL